MVLGNAMCLLRTDPDAVYEWFMEMFVDAYDWVMVPNVYAMSQFAAGEAITTKPYVSGSNYLRKMSDLRRGDWSEDWDALYWTFVRDHRDVFDAQRPLRMYRRPYDRMDPATKAAHSRRAASSSADAPPPRPRAPPDDDGGAGSATTGRRSRCRPPVPGGPHGPPTRRT